MSIKSRHTECGEDCPRSQPEWRDDEYDYAHEDTHGAELCETDSRVVPRAKGLERGDSGYRVIAEWLRSG